MYIYLLLFISLLLLYLFYILGGKETELDQFPWTVLLKVTFDYGNKQASFNCGGSLISPKYVLTAGHCVFETGADIIEYVFKKQIKIILMNSILGNNFIIIN